MKKRLMMLWHKVMVWESNRLRKKTDRIAEKLTRYCEIQHRHNNNLASFEKVVNALTENDNKKD